MAALHDASDRCAPPFSDHVAQALSSDKVAQRILARQTIPRRGDLVGVRLNLNILSRTGVAVQTVHQATSVDGHRHGKGWYRGRVLTYLETVVLEDAWFNVDQRGREAIARPGGSAKFPMASIDGLFAGLDAIARLEGLMVRFNPHRMHLFCDPDDRAVAWAERVTVHGHRAYIQGAVRYHTAQTAPARAGNAPSSARLD